MAARAAAKKKPRRAAAATQAKRVDTPPGREAALGPATEQPAPEAKPTKLWSKHAWIPCTHCGHQFSTVIRPKLHGTVGCRMRLCSGCGKRFFSYEQTTLAPKSASAFADLQALALSVLKAHGLSDRI